MRVEAPLPGDPVRVGYAAIGFGTSPVWTAKAAGIFDRNGLSVELQLIRGSHVVAEALLDGRIEFANIAAPAMVEANLRGADLVVLASGVPFLIQRLITRSDIRTARDLVGRTIGVGIRSDIDDRLTRYILSREHLVPGVDVRVAEVSSQPDCLARMTAGAVDGGLFSPPYAFEATKRGFTVLVDCADYHLDYQLGAIMARRAVVEARPDVTRRFIQSYVEGIHHLRTHPEAMGRVLHEYSGIEDAEVARQTLEVAKRCFRPAPLPSAPALQTILEHVADRYPAARSVDVAEYMEPSWVEELERSGFIQRLYAAG